MYPLLRTKRAEAREAREEGTGLTRRAPAVSADVFCLNAPECFSLSLNYEGVASFLSSVREAVGSRPRGSRLLLVEMKNIRVLGPAAALALTAELHRWQRMRGVLLRPATVADWQADVRTHLASMGFFSLLKTSVTSKAMDRAANHTQYWLPFTSGVLTDGGLARRLRVHMERRLEGSVGLKQKLYRPLVEAMKNAVEHAYPPDEVGPEILGGLGQRWWMFGIAKPEARQIKVIFLD